MSFDRRNIASGATAVTADTDLSDRNCGLYVGGAGDVNLIDGEGRTVKFSGVPAGTSLPLQVRRVLSSGTTATLILGYVA
jgi:hypothetical protein